MNVEASARLVKGTDRLEFIDGFVRFISIVFDLYINLRILFSNLQNVVSRSCCSF